MKDFVIGMPGLGTPAQSHERDQQEGQECRVFRHSTRFAREVVQCLGELVADRLTEQREETLVEIGAL